MRLRAVAAVALGVSVATAGAVVRADGPPVTPWVDDSDVPPPTWARSVVAKPGEHGRPGDMEIFVEPSAPGAHRGVTAEGTTLPFFGTKRGPGCSDRWWLVGPLAWTCADGAALSPAEPVAPASASSPDGLAASYFFVASKGADAYDSLDAAQDGAPNRELEGGWAVAIVEQRTAGDPAERWGRTTHGLWIAMHDLEPAHPSLFHGETLSEGHLDFAWVLSERASVWPVPSSKGKPVDTLARFERVRVFEEAGPMVRVGDAAWMFARDLARPHVAAPPAEVTHPGERWVDVELATQTLVAYEGTVPVYATLVSTGRGPAGTNAVTPTGVHRIWVKILASDMGNVERDEAEHYSMESVPYVQFFDAAVALHGTYWHGDFGHVRSHGCVNMAPLDAKWMFTFTGPRMPGGWAAVYPTSQDEGTFVRVR